MRITKLTLAACLCAAIAITAALPLHAQDQPQNQRDRDAAQPQQPQQRERASEATITIDLDFAGGTAEKYIDAVRKQAPDINIVVTADLSDVPMPAIRLRRVNPGSALQVLERLPRDLPGRRIEISVGGIGQRVPNDATIWTVQAQIQPFDGPALQKTVIIEIGELLQGNLKAEAVLTAIETALNMVKDGAAETQIRFHPDTGLLIARGTPANLNTVEQVIDQLRDRMRRQQAQQQQQSSLRQDAEQAAQLRNELGKAKAELQRAMQERTVYETRADSLHQELEQVRREIATRDNELRALMDQLAAARREQPATNRPQ